MIKLKKLVINDAITVLRDEELKGLTGGYSKKENNCHSYGSWVSCTGVCYVDDGTQGKCVWVDKYDACFCAAISLGY